MDSKPTRKQRLRKVLVSLLILVAAVMVVVSIARLPATDEEVPPREVVPANVDVITVEPIPRMSDLLELPGTVEPYRVVDVPVEEDGRIAEILCDEGQQVQQGQVLLRLDTALMEAEFERAKAQADFDERTLERSRELLERGVLNKSQVEEAEAKAIVSGAVLEVAKTNLDRATVRAPLSGTLNALTMEVGEYVHKGNTVAQVVDVEKMKVIIHIPERDIHYVRLGTGIEMTVDALQRRSVRGQIAYISEIADPSTRTTRVEVDVDNRQKLLKSGMIARAQFSRRVLRDVMMVPLSAVIPLEEGRIAYVASNGRAEQREVELGMIRGTRVQVVKGLQAGDQLIVAGHRQVGPGQRINIINSN
jgi:membrane fusion protein (multidrug efflux system)